MWGWSQSSGLLLHKLHFEIQKYNTSTEYSIRVFPRGPSGPSYKLLDRFAGLAKNLFWKGILFDVDNTLSAADTEGPSMIFARKLVEGNRYLLEKKNEIFQHLGMLEKAKDYKIHERALEDIFRKGSLSKQQYTRAYEYAAENFSLVGNYDLAMREMKEMGYKPLILTAAPYEFIEKSKDALLVEMENVWASKFHFNSNDLFYKLKLNLGESRSATRDRIMQESVHAVHGIEITVDDNPVMKAGWNHVYFQVKQTEPMSENVSVPMPEARYDLTVVPRVGLERLERCQGVMVAISERDWEDSVYAVHKALEFGSYALTNPGSEFLTRKLQFIDYSERHIEKMGPIFPVTETKIEVNLEELRLEKSQTKSKKIIEKIIKVLSDTLEAQAPAELVP